MSEPVSSFSGILPFGFAALALLSAAALAFSIYSCVQLMRSSIHTTTVLAPQMQVELPSGGPKVIYLKGPRGVWMAGFALTLRDARGNPIELTRILIPYHASGLKDVTESYARCQLPSAGTYHLTANNIPKSSRAMSVLIGEPIQLRFTAWGLAIVLSGLLMIASVVLAGVQR